jgi:hypothetical protein
MYNSSVDAAIITGYPNESVSATVAHGFVTETPIVSENFLTVAVITFRVLKFVIGAAGVVTNVFVLIVMFGFMQLKAKVLCWCFFVVVGGFVRSR